MLTIKYLLILSAAAMLVMAAAILVYDVYLLMKNRRASDLASGAPAEATHRSLRWKQAVRLATASVAPLLLGLSIAVVPSGMAAVRISQLSGTQPGVLYAGSHFIVPLVDSLTVYDIRDRVYSMTAGPIELVKDQANQPEVLEVQSKEGLPIGLGITVRYHLDVAQLVHIHETLPAAVDREVVQPVIGSAFREMTQLRDVRTEML